MNIITIGNASSHIECSDKIHSSLSKILSYEIDGAHFARQYSPYWDGRIKHLDRHGNFPTGLLWLVQEHLKTIGQPFRLLDCRTIPLGTLKLSAKWMKDDDSIMEPHYYQRDAVTLSERESRGVFHMGTGAGKSLTAAMICDRHKLNTLVVTPDLGLREQLATDFERWFGKIQISKSVASNAPIVISNIQALAKVDKRLFERFEMLMIDEFHHAAAKTYQTVNSLCTNAYYRYGFTGTFVRPDGQDMTMHGVLSNVIFTKTTSELIEEDFLVRPHITILKHDLHGYKRLRYKDAYDALSQDEKFHSIVTMLAEQKIEEGKQTLILVRRKEHGARLSELISESVYLNGDDGKDHREEMKRAFIDRKVRCLIATQIFGEGIDIPSIDVLINARAEKTEIQTSQGIGRALRKTDGKDKAEVFDFLFTGQRNLQSHSLERIATYRKQPAFQLIFKRAPDPFM